MRHPPRFSPRPFALGASLLGRGLFGASLFGASLLGALVPLDAAHAQQPLRPSPPGPPGQGTRSAPATSSNEPNQALVHRGSDAAIEGVRWLLEHQDADGRWDTDGFMKHDRVGPPSDGAGEASHDIGVTGLALLAILSEGSTLRMGPHRKNIRRAMSWLKQQQDSASGRFGTDAAHDSVYDHLLATLAVAEAGETANYRVARALGRRGLRHLESLRQRGPTTRYRVWHTADRVPLAALGIHDVAPEAPSRPWAAFGLCIDHFGGLPNPQPNVAVPKAWSPYDPLTAPTGALAGMLLAQQPTRHPFVQRATSTPLARRPPWQQSLERHHQAHQFYLTREIHHRPRPELRTRSAALMRARIASQRTDGNQAGSWDPVGRVGACGGRVFATAMSVLVLRSHIRYASQLGQSAPGRTAPNGNDR